MTMLEIDGSRYSGSGTIVRQAVAFAALTGQAVHLVKARVRRPTPGIRMKLRINSGCQRNGFLWLVQALTQYWCGGSSCARRLRRHTCCGGTGPWEHAAQGDCGLQDGVHPASSRGLEMPDDFEHTPCPLFLHPHSRTQLWVERLREHNEPHAAIELP